MSDLRILVIISGQFYPFPIKNIAKTKTLNELKFNQSYLKNILFAFILKYRNKALL